MIDPTSRTEFGAVPKADDLEVAFAVVEVENLWFIDIRDRVVSNGKYGRGILIPLAQVGSILSLVAQMLKWNEDG